MSSVSVTLGNGDVRHIPIKSSQAVLSSPSLLSPKPYSSKTGKKGLGLLSVPMEELDIKAEKMVRARAMRGEKSNNNKANNKVKKQSESQLWVDKVRRGGCVF